MEQEKQQYINDNLIEKGYNPDDLFNYCYRLKGIGIENLSLNELKNMIENFKNEQLIISLQSLKNKKEKKLTPFEILYSDTALTLPPSVPIPGRAELSSAELFGPFIDTNLPPVLT